MGHPRLGIIYQAASLTLCPAPPTRRTEVGSQESTESTTVLLECERVVVMIFSPSGGVAAS